MGSEESDPDDFCSLDSETFLRFSGFFRVGGVLDLTRKEYFSGVVVDGDSERDLVMDFEVSDKPSSCSISVL